MSYAYTIIGLFFLALAWLNYLRPDGIKLPLMKAAPEHKDATPGAFTDISDYLDKEVVSFDELAEEERNACCLFANIICGAIFLLLSLV